MRAITISAKQMAALERLDRVEHLPGREAYIRMLERLIADGCWSDEWDRSIEELERRDQLGMI